MDDVVNRLARELSEAIGEAVAEDPRVEVVRERARSKGFELKVSLEAVIGFMKRVPRVGKSRTALETAEAPNRKGKKDESFNSNDLQFMRSLRISAGEAQEKEVE